MDYSKFNKSNGLPYAFVELTSDQMQTTIPVGAKWGTKDDGTQKTIDEFVIMRTWNLNGSKCLILLCAMEAPTMRQYPVNTNDLDDWATYLSAILGISCDNWLTNSEYLKRTESGEYKLGEL